MGACMSSPTASAGQGILPTLDQLTSSASTTTSSVSIPAHQDLVSSITINENSNLKSSDLTTVNEATMPMTFSPSNTNETSEPFETFACFSRLPAELRLKIWKEADANEPRIVIINEAGFVANCWKTPKTIYFVNKEARSESLRLNPFLHFAWASPRIAQLNYNRARFNPEIDTLLFDGCSCNECSGGLEALHMLQMEKANDKNLEKIRHVGISTYGQSVNFAVAEMECKALPNLVDITLCLLDYNETADAKAKFRTFSDEDEDTYLAANPDGEDLDAFFVDHQKDMVEGLKKGIWNGGIPPKVHRAILVGGKTDCLLKASKLARARDRARDGDGDGDVEGEAEVEGEGNGAGHA